MNVYYFIIKNNVRETSNKTLLLLKAKEGVSPACHVWSSCAHTCEILRNFYLRGSAGWWLRAEASGWDSLFWMCGDRLRVTPWYSYAFFFWAGSHGLRSPSLLGFHSFPHLYPLLPPSSPSASWLFAWIANEKDKYFKLIKMYFDLWSSVFQVGSGGSLLFSLSYGESVSNVVRQACWSFVLQDTVSAFNLMLPLIKKYQHWREHGNSSLFNGRETKLVLVKRRSVSCFFLGID